MTNYELNRLVQKIVKEFLDEFDNDKFKGTMWYMDNNIHIVSKWLESKIRKSFKNE